MDYVAAEKLLRSLLKQSPAHSAGMLQLARLLADVHFARSTVVNTPEVEAVMNEICGLYERSIAITKEVNYEFTYVLNCLN